MSRYLFLDRPLIPIGKLTVSETYENYMSRSHQVTKEILSDCKNTGKSLADEGECLSGMCYNGGKKGEKKLRWTKKAHLRHTVAAHDLVVPNALSHCLCMFLNSFLFSNGLKVCNFFLWCACIVTSICPQLHPVSAFLRKQCADCSSRLFPWGLHTPAAGFRPAKRQRLHPRSSKGYWIAFSFMCWSPKILFLMIQLAS